MLLLLTGTSKDSYVFFCFVAIWFTLNNRYFNIPFSQSQAQFGQIIYRIATKPRDSIVPLIQPTLIITQSNSARKSVQKYLIKCSACNFLPVSYGVKLVRFFRY